METSPHEVRPSVMTELAAALDQLAQGAKSLQLLPAPADRLSSALGAIARAKAKLVGPGQAVLLVALAGGSGSGKSSLVNALAGHPIARVSPVRPCTQRATAYLHASMDRGLLPVQLATEADLVTHERDELAHLVIIDTPDLDSFRTQHRAYTVALLKAVNLVLYVVTSQTYQDERVWSVLESEQAFSKTAVALGKVDLLTADEQAALRADLAQSLARVGLAEAPLFCVSSMPERMEDEPDRNELPRLRQWLVESWQAKQIAELRRRQAEHVMQDVRRELEALAPTGLQERVSGLRAWLTAQAQGWGHDAARRVGPRWRSVRQAIWPAITLARHERLSGPFRAYLRVMDAVQFGPALWSQHAGDGLLAEALRRQLSPAPEPLLTALALAAGSASQQVYEADLPVAAWGQRGGEKLQDARLVGDALADRLAQALEANGLGSTVPSGPDRLISALGLAGPVITLLWALGWLAYGLFKGPPFEGWAILGQAAAMCLVWWMALHLGMGWITGQRQEAVALEPLAGEALGAWLAELLADEADRYGKALQAERERLLAPLAKLQALLSMPA